MKETNTGIQHAGLRCTGLMAGSNNFVDASLHDRHVDASLVSGSTAYTAGGTLSAAYRGQAGDSAVD